MKNPSEHEETCILHDELVNMKIPHWKISQETYTSSWYQKVKNKDEGVRPGLSDFLIVIPKDVSFVGRTLLIFLELKKAKVQLKRKSPRGKKGDWVSDPNSQPTVEQMKFIDLMMEVADVEGFVAHGSSEALSQIRRYLVQ